MFNIKNSLFFLFCLVSFGINAQNTSLSGNISTGLDPLVNVEVTIRHGSFTLSTMTNEEGNYRIENIPSIENLTFEFDFEDNPLNGVSTYDYILGAKHILGITPFDSARKYIAMDINKSGHRIFE